MPIQVFDDVRAVNDAFVIRCEQIYLFVAGQEQRLELMTDCLSARSPLSSEIKESSRAISKHEYTAANRC